jgi:hypothetical protein
MSLLQNSNAISSGGYDINNSLRFRGSNSANLQRTPASATNRRTWTWSAWVKRGTLGTTQGLFMGNYDGNDNSTYFGFSGDQFFFFNRLLTVANGNIYTTPVYRDVSAWYHVVVAMDTTQATAANRFKLYINGTQVTSFAIETYPTQNTDMYINSNVQHNIGFRRDGSTNNYFDGYLAEINFVDGSQLTPSSFGETDTTTGSWKPKAYTGTYGTNGFYLKFSDIATTSGSNAGLGKDFSGNANYWTTNNISVTAGTTYDAMIDSPTLTSATVANYCVLNPLGKYNSGVTLSNGNLTEAQSTTYRTTPATMFVSSGKWYAEMIGEGEAGILREGAFDISTRFGFGTGQSGSYIYNYYDGQKANNGTAENYGGGWGASDVIGIAMNLDAGTITFYKNNVSQGVAYSSLPAGNYTFGTGHANATVNWNFGQRPFAYTPPTGFKALNTYNLPDSTIKKGNSYMDVLLWTGNEATPRAITGSQFAPDFVWLKARSIASQNHHFVDSVRGFGTNTMRTLYSQATVAEDSDKTNLSTAVSYGNVLSLDSNGFTVQDGSNGNDQTNTNAATYVSWLWKAGSSTVTNTSGTISSQVRANPTAGFSVVTWTANGVNGATVGHGLGVAPKMIIVKCRSNTQSWPVYHTTLGNTKYLMLNSTAAEVANIGMWNNTSPTSTVFTTGDSGFLWSSGFTYVAYCWAEIAGFSKFGSYTGNGSTDGPFIYLGFRPKYLMVKRATNDVGEWGLHDTARDTYNTVNKVIFAHASTAEIGSIDFYDFTANGFKIRSSNDNRNASGSTYIYAAFAENPFKNANAR